MAELKPAQRLAVLIAVEKAVKEELKRIQAEADEYLHEMYDETGADRIKIKLGDTEVGTFSLVFSKDEFEVTDQDALNEFLLLNGLATEKKTIDPTYMVEVMARIKDDMPQAIITEVEPSKDFSKLLKRVDDTFVIEGTNQAVPGIAPRPATIKNSRLTGCDPKTVIPILRGLPETLDTMLLGGGE